MKTTLIIYESHHGSAKKAAMILGTIIGNTKVPVDEALATAKDDWVRCTPLEYIYLNGMFYIISEGGLKCKGLWQNENISAGIYDEYHTMANLKGIQITGKAAFVEIMSDEYQEVLLKRQLPLKKIDQLPINLYLIRISPVKYEILNSDFKKDGFDVKQILELV